MAPTVPASATYASSATETDSIVPLPSGWQVGDVCYIGWECTATAASVTTPAGCPCPLPGPRACWSAWPPRNLTVVLDLTVGSRMATILD